LILPALLYPYRFDLLKITPGSGQAGFGEFQLAVVLFVITTIFGKFFSKPYRTFNRWHFTAFYFF